MKTMIAAVLAAGVAVAGCGTVRNMVTAEILTCGEFHSIQEGMHFLQQPIVGSRVGSRSSSDSKPLRFSILQNFPLQRGYDPERGFGCARGRRPPAGRRAP